MNLNDLFTEEKVRLDPKCWKGKKIGNPKTKMKGGVRVNNCVPAESAEQGVAEAFDSQGYHTSVSKGKYLPSEYGQDENNLYLHDMMNSAHDGSGPKLVTIDDKRIATEVAAMFGGYVEKTPMHTYRIYRPRGATQSAKTPELTDVAEGSDENDPVAAFLARGGEIQRGKLHKPRKGERWQGSSHIGAAGGRGTKGRVSGLSANTNPKGGKPVVSAEGTDVDQKIGGRHDPDEFDSMVARLKKLAGAGPMKTVWDPQRRVYRNVPVAQQPTDKK